MYYGTAPIITNGLIHHYDSFNSLSMPSDPTENLLLWSQDFTNSVWEKGGATVTSTTQVAPDGTNTACLIDDTNASITPSVPIQNFISTTPYTTVSIYTKKGTASSRVFLLRNLTTSTNFDTLTFNYSSVGSVATGWRSEDVGNGWFRLSYTRTTGITPGNQLSFYYGRGGAATSGSTDTWLVWGAQAESSLYATPYIISTSTKGIRNRWSNLANLSQTATLLTGSVSSSMARFNAPDNKNLYFDGTGSFVNVPNISLSGSFTISMIVNTFISPSSSFNNRDALIAQNSSSFEIRGIELSSTSSISLKNLGTYISEDYPLSNILPNKFYNISIVRTNNNTINIYVNGTRTDLGISNTQFLHNVSLDSIANELQTRYFNGSIPVISVYNRALSETEIKQNVASLNGRYNFDTAVQLPQLTNSLIETLRVKADNEGSNFQTDIMSSSLADLNRIHSLGLLESASLVITPATYKEGLIYNIKPRSDSYNLIKYSQDFTSAGWTFNRISASFNNTDPFNSTGSSLLTITGSGVVRMNQSVLMDSNIPYNISWYVSQSNSRYANILFCDAGEVLLGATQIDFTSQSFYIKNGGAVLSFNPRNLTLQSLSNGWYRASYVVTPTASISNKLYKTMVIPNTSSLAGFTSDVSSSVFVYGCQITKGEELLPYQRIISASNPYSTFTRGSTATTIDKNGFITQVPYNLVTNTNNSLTIGGGTVIRNAAIAPDGAQTADVFTKTGNLSIVQTIGLESVSPHSGSLYTISFWTKLADTGSTITNMPVEIFTYSGSTARTQIQPPAYQITNQWQRIERVISLTEPLVSNLSIRFARETGTTGPLIGRSFSIWGAQLVKGSGSLDYQSNLTRFSHPAIDYSSGQPAIRASVYSENQFFWSSDLTNPVWIKSGLTVSTSSALSPSGEFNSFTLTATASNAFIKQTPNQQNRVPLMSAYIKRKTGTNPIILSSGIFTSSILPTNNWQQYQVSGFIFTGSYTASLGNYTVTTTIPHGFEVGDLQLFYISSINQNISATVTSTPTTSSYTFTSGTTTASGSCFCIPRGGKITIVNQGDEIDIWGPKAEGTGYSTVNSFSTTSSLSYVKDYVPTAGTQISRGDELINLSNLSSFIQTNSSSGSFYIEFAFPHTPNSFYTLFELIRLFNPAATQFARLEALVNQGTGYQGYRWRQNPSSLFTSTSPHSPLLTFTKSALVLTSGNMKFFVNGIQQGTTQTLSTPVDLTLDRIFTGSPYMLIKSFIYYPFTLTDSQAISLTT